MVHNYYLDNNNCIVHHIFWFHFVKSEVTVLDWGICLRKIQRLKKQSPPISHNDGNIDGAKLLLSVINTILDILMHFRRNLCRNTYFLLIVYLSLLENFKQSRQDDHRINWYTLVWVVQYARLFGVLRENALVDHDIKYAGHYEKSLCSENDPHWGWRKMKLISLDWDHAIKKVIKGTSIFCVRF